MPRGGGHGTGQTAGENGQRALCKRAQGERGYSREARRGRGSGAEAEHDTPGIGGFHVGLGFGDQSENIESIREGGKFSSEFTN